MNKYEITIINCRKPIRLLMDEVRLTSVMMKFKKEGQSYEIPLTGYKVNLDQNKTILSTMAILKK